MTMAQFAMYITPRNKQGHAVTDDAGSGRQVVKGLSPAAAKDLIVRLKQELSNA